MMKEDNHIFQGMQRDSAMSRQLPLFLWDAHNVRITNRGDDTQLTITNEKSNEQVSTFRGVYVGHCIINNCLILFTCCAGESYINKIEKKSTLDGDDYPSSLIYYGDLNFSLEHPIEAIGSYESESIQKVYWVDGVNQPRVINIASENIEQLNNTQFDFVLTLQLNETIRVSRIMGEGLFTPGTIQYAFTYYRLHGQLSKIFHTTPLQYIAYDDRGGRADKTVACSFLVTLLDLDLSFDYVRIYSIHRTSYDTTPTVKRVIDLRIGSTEDGVLQFIDNGTIGNVISDTELLYVGGTAIIANTLAEKDNTLFLGGITLDKSSEILEELKSYSYSFVDTNGISYPSILNPGGYYSYVPSSIETYLAGFKTNETYRLGILALISTGEWLPPVFIEDAIVSELYPQGNKETILWRTKKLETLDSEFIGRLSLKGVRRLRTCVVFPKPTDRSILCLGVLNPTVYQGSSRKNNSPFALASWFFRPAFHLDSGNYWNKNTKYASDKSYLKGAYIQWQHGYDLFAGSYGAEVQTDLVHITGSSNYRKDNFYVDENIVTFHSPELEFDNSFSNIDFLGVELNIIGCARLSSVIGDSSIETSSVGFNDGRATNTKVGYLIDSEEDRNGGLVAMPFYYDAVVPKNIKNEPLNLCNYLVYPWHRSGSLNNDLARAASEEKPRSAVLKKKVISNLKFFGYNQFFVAKPYSITSPLLFNATELLLTKIDIPYIYELSANYYGIVDTLITTEDAYPIYGVVDSLVAPLLTSVANPNDVITLSSDPVRMQYKSSPHIVFSLRRKALEREIDSSVIELLPRMEDWGLAAPAPEYTGFLDGYQGDKDEYKHIIYWIVTEEELESLDNVPALANYCALVLLNEEGTPEWKLKKRDYSSRDLKTWKLMSIVSNDILKFKLGTNYIGLSRVREPRVLEALGITTISDHTAVDNDHWAFYYKTTYSQDGNFTVENTSLNSVLARGEATSWSYSQARVGNIGNDFSPYLWIGELVRLPKSRFGGTTDDALQQNLWIPAGDPIRLDELGLKDLIYKYGDTWYSRYDCLKTYPFTSEDENQVVEIGSFLLETRINIDGRYDRNRGNLSNLSATPENFNLLNKVYTQKDNYFNYKILDDSLYETNEFLNLFTWTLEKQSGADVDLWTNVTLATTYNLKGDKGTLNKIVTLGDDIYCFQDHAIYKILFNSRVLIPVSDGVPIEISNGGKLEGTRIIQEYIGCLNKWSICTTPRGIYFIDNHTNAIYLFDGLQCKDLSTDLGLSTWVGEQYTNAKWVPKTIYNANNGIRTFYDYENRDVYFVPGKDLSGREALCYNETLQLFTSFMNYEGTPAMFNWQKGFYSLWSPEDLRPGFCYNSYLWKNFSGNSYNSLYGVPRPFSFSFISNSDGDLTKVFDNIEYMADIWDYGQDTPKLISDPIFDYIKVENEYLDTGKKPLEVSRAYSYALARARYKYRMWRAMIPRNKNSRERIRNPWAKITLGCNEDKGNVKILLHNIKVRYSL